MNSSIEVRNAVEKALEELIKNDSFLLNINVNERTLTHKLGQYLEKYFPTYHVDCEYNRDGEVPKKLEIETSGKSVPIEDIEATTVYPDLIIHKRGTDDNFLVIEAKKTKSNHSKIIDDTNKLRAYKSDEKYKYKHAFLVKFPVEEDLKKLKLHDLIEEI